jgi:tagatose-1,6-bisphosphate aldolase
MKVLLDIKDDKADFVMELLSNLKFVKAEALTPYKSKVLRDIKEAVDEVNQIKAGKKKAQPLSDFLNGL